MAALHLKFCGLASMPTNFIKDNAESIRIAMTTDRQHHKLYSVSTGFPASPRAQLEALLAVAQNCAQKIGIAPNDSPDAKLDFGFNGDLFTSDFGWR